MTDSSAQNNYQSDQTHHQSPPSTQSYVDQYLPPAQPEPMLTESHTQALPQHSTPAPTQPPVLNTSSAVTVSESADTPSNSQSEALEDQNIFDLLGISEATDDEKEAFLDELQQVIWEDFVEKDVELLLTEDELKEFRAIAEKTTQDEEERQSQMIDYLEKLIPDLEKIMLEKALDLKEEMTRERIKDYLQLFSQEEKKLEDTKQAQTLADDQKWRSAAKLLNSIVA